MVDQVTDPSMRDEEDEIWAGVGFGPNYYKQVGLVWTIILQQIGIGLNQYLSRDSIGLNQYLSRDSYGLTRYLSTDSIGLNQDLVNI